MQTKMRVMSERPLNAETPVERLRSWITANEVFFKRNQGDFSRITTSVAEYSLRVEGEVERVLELGLEDILELPKATVANTLECSGNGRSLLGEKAAGNPWTIGGVGNAIWGGVWLRDVLQMAGLKPEAAHVAFEGLDQPLGRAAIKFVRSIPLKKALDSTLLAYEMNGEPLPLAHGFPLRGLALGWTGANSVKWLRKITVLDRPFAGFYMDKVYRVFHKGEDPTRGKVVTEIKVKAIITKPAPGEMVRAGRVLISGAAYAGEARVRQVQISVDNGTTWVAAELVGPNVPYGWRQWQYRWQAPPGEHVILARATDDRGRQQPLNAEWNVLGYGNNGVHEHALHLQVKP